MHNKFAKWIKGADAKAHGKVIIDSKDLEYNYDFARSIEGAHGQVILDSDSIKYNTLFMNNVSGANIKDHKDRIAYLEYINNSKPEIEESINQKIKKLSSIKI